MGSCRQQVEIWKGIETLHNALAQWMMDKQGYCRLIETKSVFLHGKL